VQAEVKELKRSAKDLHSRLAQFEAEAVAARAESIGSVRFASAALDGADANALKQIAAAVVSRPGHVAVVLSSPPPSFVVVARSADLAVDAAAILKRMVECFGGKGGGRPDLAQGGGLEGSTEEMLAHARMAARG
jgi:alanyl-tRNA synthetase